MKILPLGSVIGIQKKKFIISGYRPIENSGNVAAGYMILPYPLGYINQNSIFICPVSSVEEVFFEGYQNERSERFLTYIEGIETEGVHADYAGFLEFLKLAREKVIGQEED